MSAVFIRNGSLNANMIDAIDLANNNDSKIRQFQCESPNSLIFSREDCDEKIFEQRILLDIMDFFACKSQHFDKKNLQDPDFGKHLETFIKTKLIPWEKSQATQAKSLVLLISLIKSTFSDKSGMEIVNTDNFLEDCLEKFKTPWKFLLIRSILLEEEFFEAGVFKNSQKYTLQALKKSLSDIFENKITNSLQKIREKLEKSRDFHKNYKERLFFALTILQDLKILLNKQMVQLSDICSGKFAKNSYSINHTLLLAENGGFYCLLNRDFLNKRRDLWSLFDEEYLESLRSLNSRGKSQNLTVGSGAMGFVGLGITLWGNEQKTVDSGDLVCVKEISNKDANYRGWWQEYSNFNVLRGKPINIPDVYDLKMPVWSAVQRDPSMESLRENQRNSNVIIKDNLMNDESKRAKKYSSDRTYTKNQNNRNNSIIPGKSSLKTCESYIIMEFLPYFSSQKIFSKKGLCYKKPGPILNYLISLFENVIEVMNNGYFLSDLKPSNTLYDRFSQRCFLIDFAGVIPTGNRENLVVLPAKSVVEFTNHYIAIEIKEILKNRDASSFDGCKAMAFSLGTIVQEVAKVKKTSENIKKKHPVFKKLKNIADALLISVPERRISVEEALQKLKKIEEKLLQIKVDCNNFLKIREISLRNTRKLIISDSFRASLNPLFNDYHKFICVKLDNTMKTQRKMDIFSVIYLNFLIDKQKNIEKTSEFPIFFPQDCEGLEIFFSELTSRISFSKDNCFFFMQMLGNSDYQWSRLKNTVKRLGKERTRQRFCCLFNEIKYNSRDFEEFGFTKEDFFVYEGDETRLTGNEIEKYQIENSANSENNEREREGNMKFIWWEIKDDSQKSLLTL